MTVSIFSFVFRKCSGVGVTERVSTDGDASSLLHNPTELRFLTQLEEVACNSYGGLFVARSTVRVRGIPSQDDSGLLSTGREVKSSQIIKNVGELNRGPAGLSCVARLLKQRLRVPVETGAGTQTCDAGQGIR